MSNVGTLAITVTAAPTTGLDNLPSDYTLVTDTTFDGVDGLLPPISNTTFNSERWRRTSAFTNRIALGSAAANGLPTGPFGDTVIIGTIPQNFNVNSSGNLSGVGPFTMESYVNDSGSFRVKDIYMSFWHCHPANYDDGSNNGSKMGWWLGPLTSGGVGSRTNHFWAFPKQPQNVGTPYLRMQTQFNDGTAFGPNRNCTGTLLPYGVWRKYEIIMEGGDPGVANGRWRAWINGAQVGDFQNILISPASAVGALQGFRGVRWNPTWGANQLQPTNTVLGVARWAWAYRTAL